jgi:hypothetical protein
MPPPTQTRAVNRNDLYFWLSIAWLIGLVCAFMWIFSRMVS